MNQILLAEAKRERDQSLVTQWQHVSTWVPKHKYPGLYTIFSNFGDISVSESMSLFPFYP